MALPRDSEPEVVLSVGELLELVRGSLRDDVGEVVVEGEVASLFRSRPGHLYFDLKDERGTILHLHAGGVMMEDDWAYYRGVRPVPALWIRDHAGRWHATRSWAPRPLGDDGEVTLELEIAPPLEAGNQWIDVVAAGQSAQVRARLPVRWTWNP
jgi:hypothetical protein